MNRSLSLFFLATLALTITQARSTGIGFDSSDTVLSIAPSATDARIATTDPPHVVIYDTRAKPGNLLLFLAGTGGRPPGPVRFLNAAVERGYRVISLSYDDTPAVAQVCDGKALHEDPDCAKTFRERRIYGEPAVAPIDDAPQDAIVNRFTKLLQYLAASDPPGNWNQYLKAGTPDWSRIAIAGQSQGGGMAEFIAQRELVARVIVFSGGWDRLSRSEIAHWYSARSVTPPDHWFGAYNASEPMASLISQTYAALQIPQDHIFTLDLAVRPGVSAHADGIGNPAYQNIWDKMLGNPY